MTCPNFLPPPRPSPSGVRVEVLTGAFFGGPPPGFWAAFPGAGRTGPGLATWGLAPAGFAPSAGLTPGLAPAAGWAPGLVPWDDGGADFPGGGALGAGGAGGAGFFGGTGSFGVAIGVFTFISNNQP